MISVARGLSSDDGTSEGSLAMSPFQAVFTGINPLPAARRMEIGSSASEVLAKNLSQDTVKGEWGAPENARTNSFTASENWAFRFSTSFFIAAGVRDEGRVRGCLIPSVKAGRLSNVGAHELSAFRPRTESLNSRTRTWSCESCS